MDTHSAFEDPILSLSLGSSVVMEFKNQDGQVIPVLLPQRSLLIMSQESRFVLYFQFAIVNIHCIICFMSQHSDNCLFFFFA